MSKEKQYRDSFIAGFILGLFILIYCQVAYSTTKVAVIDSGYDPTDGVILCPDGHYDFVNNKPGIALDTRDHGTSIARIISKYAVKDFCLVIYRVFGDGGIGDAHMVASAVRKAISDLVNVINLSLSSNGSGFFSDEEYAALKDAGSQGIQMFVAAGNDSKNLTKMKGSCNVYPACYVGITGFNVVGTSEQFRKRANMGSIITIKEPFCEFERCGTSISTAIATGKYVRRLQNVNYNR